MAVNVLNVLGAAGKVGAGMQQAEAAARAAQKEEAVLKSLREAERQRLAENAALMQLEVATPGLLAPTQAMPVAKAPAKKPAVKPPAATQPKPPAPVPAPVPALVPAAAAPAPAAVAPAPTPAAVTQEITQQQFRMLPVEEQRRRFEEAKAADRLRRYADVYGGEPPVVPTPATSSMGPAAADLGFSGLGQASAGVLKSLRDITPDIPAAYRNVRARMFAPGEDLTFEQYVSRLPSQPAAPTPAAPAAAAAAAPAPTAPVAAGVPAGPVPPPPIPPVGLMAPELGSSLDSPVMQRVSNFAQEAGLTRQQTEEVAKAPSVFYGANVEAITPDIQQALSRRDQYVRMADVYRRAGMGAQYAALVEKIDGLNDNLVYLQGMQGLAELSQANDPRRLSAVLTYSNGINTQIIPRDDGTYNILINNKVAEEGVPLDSIVSNARTSFDKSYTERMQKRAEAEYELGLEMEMERLKGLLGLQQEQAKLGAESYYTSREILEETLSEMQLEELKAANKAKETAVFKIGDDSAIFTRNGRVYYKGPPTVTPEGIPMPSIQELRLP